MLVGMLRGMREVMEYDRCPAQALFRELECFVQVGTPQPNACGRVLRVGCVCIPSVFPTQAGTPRLHMCRGMLLSSSRELVWFV